MTQLGSVAMYYKRENLHDLVKMSASSMGELIGGELSELDNIVKKGQESFERLLR